jgi:superfamily II DNA or RNA helicase
MSQANPKPSQFFAKKWTLSDCRAVDGKRQPAPHQKAALVALNKWFTSKRHGGDGTILVLPTGAGKTFTAAHFLCTGPISDGYKVLWLAHTHHLLEQAFGAFSDDMVGHIAEPKPYLQIRVVSGTEGHFPPRDIKASDDVIIATLQTITNAYRDELKPLRAFIESAGGKLIVVFDEAHHSPAPSYRKLLQKLGGEGALILGLTATPTFSDESKKGWLAKLFPQGLIAPTSPSKLIADGVLARPRFEKPKTAFVPKLAPGDVQRWQGSFGDVPDEVINALATNRERNALIATTYANDRKRYGKTIIFTDRWYQCEAIVEALSSRKIKAEAVYSHVDARDANVEGRRLRTRDDNAKALQRFKNSEVDVIVNVRMLTEGTDVPDAQTVFLTRQTTSQILLTQMIGRALRGPKFGGTEEANIVSFEDDWQQAIHWAEYDPLAEGRADEDTRKTFKRPPLHLISIDLVKRLAAQMDSGVNVTPGPFKSLMPLGWYRVAFDVASTDQDSVEPVEELVMVFEDERSGMDKLVHALIKSVPKAFEKEDAVLDTELEVLEGWRTEYLAKSARATRDQYMEMFRLARHVAQGHGAPEFFLFEARKDHDMDVLAQATIDHDIGPRGVLEKLQLEYSRPDRFWKALFPSVDHFRSYHHACVERLIQGATGGARPARPKPAMDEVPSFVEPTEKAKEQVKRRDRRCLACGFTKRLEVDHIVPARHGGTQDVDNLQTLCGICNRLKGKGRPIRFAAQRTSLDAAPVVLPAFDVPNGEDVVDREHCERFLTRTLNFFYACSAVSKVTIGGRGDGYYHWVVELVDGNPTAWLKPLLQSLFDRLQDARVSAGKPPLKSLTVTAPDDEKVVVKAGRRRT